MWPEMLILWRSGTQSVAMVTKLLSSYCRAPVLESYCKQSNISDSNWLRYLFSSYLVKIWLSTDDVITWQFAYFKNLIMNISGKKRDN